MKNKIIVPTDFSSAAANAYRYARALAEEYKASLEVIHIYSGTFTTTEVPPLVPLQGITEGLENQLKKFVNVYPNEEEGEIKTQLEVSTELLIGSVVDTLRRKTEEEGVLMVVMGATGEHDAVDRLFGSISSHLAQKAHCPVLLVPKGTSYRSFEKILYASNFESADSESVGRIKKMASFFHAAVHFIHVEEQDETENFLDTRAKIINSLFRGEDPEFSFSMEKINAKSVFTGLSDYAEKNQMDLMIIINRQRGFWDSMLGRSMTKKVAMQPRVPILVDHL